LRQSAVSWVGLLILGGSFTIVIAKIVIVKSVVEQSDLGLRGVFGGGV
jgi:hypothetical protein